MCVRRTAEKTADENLVEFVKEELRGLLEDPKAGTLQVAPKPPTVYLIAGVNGSGKTTSIAKLAQYLKDQGNTILLAACDTFRAAAADQLSIWADRAGCEIVKGAPGADPASVAHDACQRALARHIDVLIVDTAGRLHTQTHLMRELEKIRNVIQRLIPGAPHEVLLVIDATNGQNAIRQAEVFTKSIGCTGVILTKLDGTAKGGVVVAVRQTMNLPVKFVGVGEALDDLQPFDADTFVDRCSCNTEGRVEFSSGMPAFSWKRSIEIVADCRHVPAIMTHEAIANRSLSSLLVGHPRGSSWRASTRKLLHIRTRQRSKLNVTGLWARYRDELVERPVPGAGALGRLDCIGHHADRFCGSGAARLVQGPARADHAAA